MIGSSIVLQSKNENWREDKSRELSLPFAKQILWRLAMPTVIAHLNQMYNWAHQDSKTGYYRWKIRHRTAKCFSGLCIPFWPRPKKEREKADIFSYRVAEKLGGARLQRRSGLRGSGRELQPDNWEAIAGPDQLMIPCWRQNCPKRLSTLNKSSPLSALLTKCLQVSSCPVKS